ncbi:MAG: hypothetical protein GXY86_03365 [Firmicutes bacterium]|nr:hypothetical protein [Bacillota bacterium]
MIAVWTNWTKPGENQISPWLTEKDHYLSWILSVETARKHFSELHLYTDSNGARILVDRLGLEFTTVTTDYDRLEKIDPQWWALAKIYSYARMEKAFVHIDSDVYLWNGLPDYLLTAPLLGQNPEHFKVGESWYQPDKFDRIAEAQGWVPKEVVWYNRTGEEREAVCCGIFGGNNTEFINYYANKAIQLAEDVRNREIWPKLGFDNILVEQYFLTACHKYHSRESGNFNNVSIRYLFDSSADAFNPQIAEEKNYTHLIGGAKRNQNLIARLENRVSRDYPECYERCLRCFGETVVA